MLDDLDLPERIRAKIGALSYLVSECHRLTNSIGGIPRLEATAGDIGIQQAWDLWHRYKAGECSTDLDNELDKLGPQLSELRDFILKYAEKSIHYILGSIKQHKVNAYA